MKVQVLAHASIMVPMRSERGTLAAIVLGSGAVFLDSSVVNVALPRIGRELPVHVLGVLEGQSYAYNGYLLTLSALLIPAGALADRRGRRATFAAGLAAFAIASALCGAAWSLEALVAFRLLQGAAGAILVPGSLALIRGSFPEDRQGAAIGTWAAASAATTLLGPFVGGALVDTVSWRAAFLVNLPILAAALLLLWRSAPESRGRSQPVDLVGAALAALAVGGLAFGAIAGQQRNWQGALPWLALGAGALSALALPLWLRHASSPLVPLELFQSRAFSVINVVTLLVYGALYVAGAYQALFLQGVLGYTAAAVGLASLPTGAQLAFFSRRFGSIGARIGPRLPLTVGPLLMAAGVLWLARIPGGSTGWRLAPADAGSWLPSPGYLVDVLPASLVFGFGLSVLVAPLTAALMASAPAAHAGVASALNNAVSRTGPQLAGAVIFVAVTAVFRTSAPAGVSPFTPRAPAAASTAAFHAAMLIAALLLVLGAASSWAGLRGQRSGGVQAPTTPTASL